MIMNETNAASTVSVIIPVYNVESYLKKSLDSVVNQTYKELEIIIIDDGATDGSPEICREYQNNDKRIIYLRQANAGLAEARNIGVRVSTGEYVTYLDSDDWFEPTFIEDILTDMLKNDCEIGQCDIYFVDGETNEKELIKLRYDDLVVSPRTDKTVLNKSRQYACGKIFRREIVTSHGFRFPKIVYEDIVTTALIVKADKIAYTPKPLINYLRNRKDSLSNTSGNTKDMVPGLKILKGMFKALGCYDDYKDEYKKICLSQFRYCGRKWGLGVNEEIDAMLRDIEEYVGAVFPGLRGFCRNKYFVHGDERLTLATEKALPYAGLLVGDISRADVVVSYDDRLPESVPPAARLLCVPRKNNPLKDDMSAAYDTAESIMEAL
jgi:glycosyltransferase involved in cell wall biosynthesis